MRARLQLIGVTGLFVLRRYLGVQHIETALLLQPQHLLNHRVFYIGPHLDPMGDLPKRYYPACTFVRRVQGFP